MPQFTPPLLLCFAFRCGVTAREESDSALAQKTRAKTSLGPTTLLFQQRWRQYNTDQYQTQHPLRAGGTEADQSETLPGGGGDILINEVSNLKHSTSFYQTAATDATGWDERHHGGRVANFTENLCSQGG